MLPLLLVAFVVVPLAELYVILQVGGLIGVLPTILILLADSVLGGVLLRVQGRAAWRRFTDTLRAGRPPAREVLDGALVLVGGALLLTPGFITDLLGFALLIPPTRVVLRGIVGRRLLQRMTVAMTSAAPRRPGRMRPGAHDVEGSAVDVDPETGHAGRHDPDPDAGPRGLHRP